DRRALDVVAGNEHAFEAELRIDGNFARIADAVAFDMQIRGRIAAHGRERTIPDAIAAHNHIRGAKHIDRVAILAGAAEPVLHVLDAIIDDHRAIILRSRTPHLDARIAGVSDLIACDQKPARVENVDGNIGNFREGAVAELARTANCNERRAGRRRECAVCDLYALTVVESYERSSVGQLITAAIEDKTGERDRVTARPGDQRCAWPRERESGRAARAGYVRAGGQREIAR